MKPQKWHKIINYQLLERVKNIIESAGFKKLKNEEDYSYWLGIAEKIKKDKDKNYDIYANLQTL